MSQGQQTAKNILYVVTAKIFSLASLLVASMMVARATNPESFGYYSVAISLVLLIDAVVGAPLDNAVVRFSSLHPGFKYRIEQIQGFIFRIKLVIGLILFVILVYFLAPISALLFDKNAPHSILIICLLSSFAVLMVRSSACYLQINKQFKRYSRLDTIQGVFRVSITSLLFVSGCTSVSIYLSVYGISAALAFFIFLFAHKQKFILASSPEPADRATMFSYIGVTSIIIILGSVTGRADLPLLSIMGNAEEVGFYSVATQLAMAGTLLASYFAIVFQPKVIQMAKDRVLGSAINKNMMLGALLVLVGLPLASYLSPIIIPLMFGEMFVESAPIFNIIIIGIIADFMIMPILMPYAIQAIPERILIGETIILVAFFLCVFIFFQISALTMAWIVTAIRIAKLALYYSFVTRHLKGHR